MLKIHTNLVPTLGDHCEVGIDLLGPSFCTAIDHKSANVFLKDGTDRTSSARVQNF